MLALVKRFLNDQAFAQLVLSTLGTAAVAVGASVAAHGTVAADILAGAAAFGINVAGIQAAQKVGAQQAAKSPPPGS